jgi:Na+(H+)/acetate symporter ActP
MGLQTLTCITIGLSLTPGYIIYFKGVFIEPFAANVPENRTLGISPQGAGVIGMALNFTVVTIVARNTAPPRHIQQRVDDIRVPNQGLHDLSSRHPLLAFRDHILS